MSGPEQPIGGRLLVFLAGVGLLIALGLRGPMTLAAVIVIGVLIWFVSLFFE